MINVSKNCVLGDNVVDLSKLDDICLLQTLHCEVLLRLTVLREQHSSKRTWTKVNIEIKKGASASKVATLVVMNELQQ